MTHAYQNQLELVAKYPEVHYEPVQNILEFANEQYRRIWTTCSPAHQKENLQKIGRFCEFADYATRPITSYRPTHIYDFLEHREETYGNKDGTLNRYIAALSKVFHHYDDEYNTVVAPRIKWRKENGNRPRFFTDYRGSKTTRDIVIIRISVGCTYRHDSPKDRHEEG